MQHEIEFWQKAYMSAKTRDMALLCFGAYAALILVAGTVAVSRPNREAPHE